LELFRSPTIANGPRRKRGPFAVVSEIESSRRPSGALDLEQPLGGGDELADVSGDPKIPSWDLKRPKVTE